MKTYIIDGYNLMLSGDLDIPGQLDLESRREYLLRQLETHAVRRQQRLIVVFDNAVMAPTMISQSTQLKVIFSAPGREADDVIRRMVRREKNPRTLTVVSSDNAIVATARDHGVRTLSAMEYSSELMDGQHRSADSDAPGISERTDEELSDDEVIFWKRLFQDPNDGE